MCRGRQAAAKSRGPSTIGCGTEMIQHITEKAERGPGGRCVVIVYESPAIREHAVQFCECLASQPESQAPQMNWWSFPVLAHSEPGDEAAEKAAEADIVVFAMSATGDLPDSVKLWIEKWLNKRGEREGALVGLLSCEEPRDAGSFREIYLRHIARRAGMDYLSHVPPTAPRAIPDSLDSFNERAGKVTSVLDGILHKHPHSAPRLMA